MMKKYSTVTAITARIQMKERLERCKICGGSALGVVEADCNLMRCRAGRLRFR